MPINTGKDIYVAELAIDAMSNNVTSCLDDRYGSKGDDVPRGIAIGGPGEVFIAGHFNGKGLDFHTGELLLDSSGTDAFVARIKGPSVWYKRFGDPKRRRRSRRRPPERDEPRGRLLG